jgi:hypothetical protein
MNQNDMIQMSMNLHEYQHDFMLFYLKLFDLFQIYTNYLYKYALNLFENMHTAPASCTTPPRILQHSCTLPHTLPHTAALLDTAMRSAAAINCSILHEFKCHTPHAAYYTPQST